MGMPDTEQKNYQYQVPVQIAKTPDRDPAYRVIDWAISMFGGGTVMLAMAIGGAILFKKFTNKWLSHKD